MTEQQAGIAGLSVFPNPTTASVTLRLDRERPTPITYSLSDVSGKTLYTSEPGKFRGDTFTIHLGRYPAGTYLLRVTAGGKESSHRILKTR